jgi:hypothetical protein
MPSQSVPLNCIQEDIYAYYGRCLMKCIIDEDKACSRQETNIPLPQGATGSTETLLPSVIMANKKSYVGILGAGQFSVSPMTVGRMYADIY